MADHKKILIFYITERSGHHSAALAIARGLEEKYPHAEVACVNAVRYISPLMEKVTLKLYLLIIKRVPKLWESLYDKPGVVKKSQGLKDAVHRWAVKKFKALIDDFKPDTIVCTQAFPCGIVADFKKFYRSSTSLVGVLTDFAPHSFWVYRETDYYIAPCLESRDLLMQKGVREDKIKILGIPVDPRFARPQDKQEIFNSFGLESDRPVILIMGGGRGLGPIKNVLCELDNAGMPWQLVVICGVNADLHRWIQKRQFKTKVLNFQFTDQVDRLMSISSLIVTKPGGITTAEALAKKLPMIILNPIPGQEARNTEVLLKKGAALKVDVAADLLPAIKKILNPAGQEGFKTHLLSKPESSLEIADFLMSHINQHKSTS